MTIKVIDLPRLGALGYVWVETFNDKQSAMIHAKALNEKGREVIVRKVAQRGDMESWEVWVR